MVITVWWLYNVSTIGQAEIHFRKSPFLYTYIWGELQKRVYWDIWRTRQSKSHFAVYIHCFPSLSCCDTADGPTTAHHFLEASSAYVIPGPFVFI